VIKKGTKITCPLCGRVVAELKDDLRDGEIIGHKKFKFYGKELKEGDYTLCPYCGFPWSVEYHPGCAMIHTEKGWYPDLFGETGTLIMIRDFLIRQGMWKDEWNELFRKRIFSE